MSSLKDRCVLVVEDEFFLADEIAELLRDAGASVLGPAPTVARAQALLKETPAPHAAVLDQNLDGVPIFPVADILTQNGVPFVFVTGYERMHTPERFAHVRRFSKPLDADRLIDELTCLVTSRQNSLVAK